MFRLLLDICGLCFIGLLGFIGYYTATHGTLPFKLELEKKEEGEEEAKEELRDTKHFNIYNNALRHKILNEDFNK